MAYLAYLGSSPQFISDSEQRVQDLKPEECLQAPMLPGRMCGRTDVLASGEECDGAAQSNVASFLLEFMLMYGFLSSGPCLGLLPCCSVEWLFHNSFPQ